MCWSRSCRVAAERSRRSGRGRPIVHPLAHVRAAAADLGRTMDPVSATRVVRGLEAIIDAAAGVLAEQSLQATLRQMSRALAGIVPFTSLAVYELDAERRELVPVFA